MISAEQDGLRLAQFRAALRLKGARHALDIFVQRAQGAGGWRCLPPGEDPPREIHGFHEVSGEPRFVLRLASGDLILILDGAGVARVPGGLPALEAGLGVSDGLGTSEGEGEEPAWALHLTQPAQADTLVRLLFDGESRSRASFRSRHWRLNVTRAGAAQIEGGYLWASKQPAARAGQQHRAGITRVLPGDVIFARAGARLIAIGIALERARSSPDPSLTSTDGWLVPVSFEMLPGEAAPAPQIAAPRGRQRSAARADAQLAEMSDDEAQILRRSLGRWVEQLEERVRWETDGVLVDQAIEEQIWLRTDIAPNDKRQLTAARQGRGRFRDNVERFEHGCRVTGVLDRRYLRATHIKPWRDASDAERLEGANGLLLSPHVVQLFARGHISFADDGTLLVSRHLNPFVRQAWLPPSARAPRAFRDSQRLYLEYHRTQLFEHVEGGRRVPQTDPQEMP